MGKLPDWDLGRGYNYIDYPKIPPQSSHVRQQYSRRFKLKVCKLQVVTWWLAAKSEPFAPWQYGSCSELLECSGGLPTIIIQKTLYVPIFGICLSILVLGGLNGIFSVGVMPGYLPFKRSNWEPKTERSHFLGSKVWYLSRFLMTSRGSCGTRSRWVTGWLSSRPRLRSKHRLCVIASGSLGCCRWAVGPAILMRVGYCALGGWCMIISNRNMHCFSYPCNDKAL